MSARLNLETMPVKDLAVFSEVLETVERAATKNRQSIDLTAVVVGLFDEELSDALMKQVSTLTHIIDIAQTKRELVKKRIAEALS